MRERHNKRKRWIWGMQDLTAYKRTEAPGNTARSEKCGDSVEGLRRLKLKLCERHHCCLFGHHYQPLLLLFLLPLLLFFLFCSRRCCVVWLHHRFYFLCERPMTNVWSMCLVMCPSPNDPPVPAAPNSVSPLRSILFASVV